MEEYILVPAYDQSGNETGYYTREPDGVSGMTVSALSELACLASGSTSTLSDLIDKIEGSGPEGNDLSEPLKPFAGRVLRLEAKDPQGRLLIPDDVCQAVLEHYAFEARKYPGKQSAMENYRSIAKAGMRIFIWVKTGYLPQVLRDSLKGHTSNYIDRLENTYDHIIADHLWSVFREGAEVLLLVEKQMRVPVDKMDLCDGSIGRRWSDYRKGREWAVGEVESYTHVYHDQRDRQEPKAYQLTELQYFRKWVRENYIPYHLPKYLADKVGKRATKEIYSAMEDLTPRVLEVTLMSRMTPKEEKLYIEYQQAKQRLLKEQVEEAEAEQLLLPVAGL